MNGLMIKKKIQKHGNNINLTRLLVDKSDRLNQQAFRFQKSSTTLRRTLWWKKVRLVAFLTALVVIILYVIAASMCGMSLSKCIGHRNQQPHF
jgi:vesicle-associated membrane protein 7